MDRLAYSINGTANMLSIGRTSVYLLIYQGKLDTFKLGRRTLVKAESIQKLLDAKG